MTVDRREVLVNGQGVSLETLPNQARRKLAEHLRSNHLDVPMETKIRDLRAMDLDELRVDALMSKDRP